MSISFKDMAQMGPQERLESELRILEGLMAGAVKAQKFTEAAKIFERVQVLLLRRDRDLQCKKS